MKTRLEQAMEQFGRGRCMSMAEIHTPSGTRQEKRCVRVVDHAEEDHVWLESRSVVDRQPLVAYWRDGAKQADMYIVGELV